MGREKNKIKLTSSVKYHKNTFSHLNVHILFVYFLMCPTV